MAFKVPVARPEVQPGSPVSAEQRIAAPEEAFGGGSALNTFKTGETLGRAAQTIGRDLTEYAFIARDQEDKAVVNDRLAQAQNYLNDVLYNKDTGLMTRQNRDAMGAGRMFADSTRKAREQFTAGMTERQRRLFEEKFRTAEAAGVRTVAIHEATQRRQYMNKSAEAAIASDIRSAMATPFDPEVRDAFVGEANRKLDELARDNGWTEEMVKDKRETMMGQYYEGIIARMVDLDPAAARAYYKEQAKNIPGDVRQKIKDMIDKGELLAFGQHFVDRAYAKHPDDAEARYKEARSIKDPEKREQALKALDERMARDDRIRKEVQRQVWSSAVSYAEKGQNVPAAIYAQLTQDQRKRLRGLMDYAINGAEPITRRPVKDLVESLKDPQLKMLSEDDLKVDFRPYLNDEDYSSLVSRWRVATGSGTKKDIDEAEYKKALEYHLRKAGLIPRNEERTRWSPEEARAYDEVEHEARTRIKASGDFSWENMNKVINDLLNEKITVAGFISPETKPLVLATPEDMENAIVEVPTGETRTSAIYTPDGERVEVKTPVMKTVRLNTAGPDQITMEWMSSQGGRATPERLGQAIFVRDVWREHFPDVPMVVTDENGPVWVDTSLPENRGKSNPNENTLYGIVRRTFGPNAPLEAYVLVAQNLRKRRVKK